MAIALRPFRNPNPLGFPGGVRPGFDASHVAAGKIKHSSISLGSGFVNLLRGAAGTKAGAPGASIDGTIGPVSSFTTTTDGYTFAGNAAVADLAGTIAVIYKKTSTSATAHYPFYTSSAAGASGIAIGAVTASSEKFDLSFGGVNSFTSNFVTATNVPYFLAVSFNASAGGSGNANFVIVNLATGQISTATASLGTSVPSASNGTYVVGNRPSSAGAALGNIAASMFAAQYLSMPQLLQWAQDPWSFWYPRTLDLTQMLVGPAAAGFKPYWANNNNLPVLGTGTY